jgi:hypothetical protein
MYGLHSTDDIYWPHVFNWIQTNNIMSHKIIQRFTFALCGLFAEAAEIRCNGHKIVRVLCGQFTII